MKTYLFGLLLAALSLSTLAANEATIEFQRPTTFADGTALPATFPLQYKVWQGVQGQAKTLVGTISTTTGSITTGLLSGATYCWEVSVITSTAGYTESPRSNEACKTFAPTSPGTVTITVR